MFALEKMVQIESVLARKHGLNSVWFNVSEVTMIVSFVLNIVSMLLCVGAYTFHKMHAREIRRSVYQRINGDM